MSARHTTWRLSRRWRIYSWHWPKNGLTVLRVRVEGKSPVAAPGSPIAGPVPVRLKYTEQSASHLFVIIQNSLARVGRNGLTVATL